MTLIQVRDVPEPTVTALKGLAAEQGLTLSAFLRAELERLARRPTNAEIARRMANHDRSGGPSTADAVREIRRLRDIS
jgi:predicted GNAT superfamily acetyltransferase